MLSQGTGVGQGSGVMKHGIVMSGGQGGGHGYVAPPSMYMHGGQPSAMTPSGHGSGGVGQSEVGSHGTGVGQGSGVMKHGIVMSGGQGGGHG